MGELYYSYTFRQTKKQKLRTVQVDNFLTFQKQAMRSLHLVQNHHCYLKLHVILFFKHQNFSLYFLILKIDSLAVLIKIEIRLFVVKYPHINSSF